MKTIDYFFVAAVAAYSYLFYEQNAGVNFLVFNGLIAAGLYARNPQLLRQKEWCWALALCLVSSTGILLYSSALAIFANCCSLLLLAAFSANRNTSALFSFLFSCFSIASAPVFMLMDGSRRFEKRTGGYRHVAIRYAAIAVAVLLCFVFFMLYQEANPLFAENTKWISFDFINFPRLVFTTFGGVLCYALFHHKTIKPIEQWENGLALLSPAAAPAEQQQSYKAELLAGTLLFACLNAMLLILNLGDVKTIWLNGQLPKGITHTAFVHNGVGALILSVMIATGLIMFLYRRQAHSDKSSKFLKWLVYLWIVQDLAMLFSTGWRNHLYIDAFNLTYKRIGVYAWLLLAILGHVFTFIKLAGNRSNWYLIRSNVAAWFCTLSLAGLVNWDVFITSHNLQKPIGKVDLVYLFELSDANIPQLIQVYHKYPVAALDQNLQFSAEGHGRNDSYTRRMHNKVDRFLKDYNNDWQSWDLRDKHITAGILNKE